VTGRQGWPAIAMARATRPPRRCRARVPSTGHRAVPARRASDGAPARRCVARRVPSPPAACPTPGRCAARRRSACPCSPSIAPRRSRAGLQRAPRSRVADRRRSLQHRKHAQCTSGIARKPRFRSGEHVVTGTSATVASTVAWSSAPSGSTSASFSISWRAASRFPSQVSARNASVSGVLSASGARGGRRSSAAAPRAPAAPPRRPRRLRRVP